MSDYHFAVGDEVMWQCEGTTRAVRATIVEVLGPRSYRIKRPEYTNATWTVMDDELSRANERPEDTVIRAVANMTSEQVRRAITAQQQLDAQALHTYLLEHDDEVAAAILELVVLRADIRTARILLLESLNFIDPEVPRIHRDYALMARNIRDFLDRPAT